MGYSDDRQITGTCRSVVDRSVTCKVEVTPIDLPSIVAHVNTTNAHPMRIQPDSVWMRIESASKRAPCERALSVVDCSV